MPSKRFPHNFEPGRKYAIPGDLLLAMIDEIERLGRVTVSGAMELSDDSQGINYHVRPTIAGSSKTTIFCLLTTDGGVDGSGSAPNEVTLTYTATRVSDGTVIGVKMPWMAQRVIGGIEVIPATMGYVEMIPQSGYANLNYRGDFPPGSGSSSGGSGSSSGTPFFPYMLVWCDEQYLVIPDCVAGGSESSSGS